MTEDRRSLEQKRFKIDTTVNITTIFTMLGVLTAIFTWGSDIRAMVVRHETQIAELYSLNTRNDEFQRTQFSELKTDIRELNNKIDYMLEYRPLPNYGHRKK